MPLITGKYDFPGIRKAGTAAISAALATTAWGAWILASPFKPLVSYLDGLLIQWLANQGLVIINLGAIYINGVVDQANFDKSMDAALAKVQTPGLTDAQKKAIDDGVKDSFRTFAHVSSKPTVAKS
jgi:hypothetical protein